jgi:hypothetical protein
MIGMASDMDVLVNPLSYILGVLSFIGFFIVARKEIKCWLQNCLSLLPVVKRRSHVSAVSLPELVPSSSKGVILLGLFLIGISLSALVMILYHALINQKDTPQFGFLFSMFLLVMLPGGLAGIAASLWIDPSGRMRKGSLLGRTLFGMILYLGLFSLAEFTGFDPFLLLFGPAVTLLVYRFSPLEPDPQKNQ